MSMEPSLLGMADTTDPLGEGQLQAEAADQPQPQIATSTNGINVDMEMKDIPVSTEFEFPANPPPRPASSQGMPTTPAASNHAVSTPTATASAAAARGSPHPGLSSMPTHPNPHGSPTRVYLNTNVTPYLLEGMKYLAVHEPEKPLKWLADFLAEKSREVEGS